MDKPLTSTELDWFGKKVRLDVFDGTDFSGLSPIVQIQAVSFTDDGHIVLYHAVKDNFGCPGGHPEPGETYEESLRREIREEIAAEMIDCGPIGYIRETNLETDEENYLLRYWANVKLLNEPVNDPCDQGRTRHVFGINEAIEKLNWGKGGEILVNLAEKARKISK